jgi:hypothetical protein
MIQTLCQQLLLVSLQTLVYANVLAKLLHAQRRACPAQQHSTKLLLIPILLLYEQGTGCLHSA